MLAACEVKTLASSKEYEQGCIKAGEKVVWLGTNEVERRAEDLGALWAEKQVSLMVVQMELLKVVEKDNKMAETMAVLLASLFLAMMVCKQADRSA